MGTTAFLSPDNRLKEGTGATQMNFEPHLLFLSLGYAAHKGGRGYAAMLLEGFAEMIHIGKILLTLCRTRSPL